MNEKDYKNRIIKMLDDIHSLQTLKCIYELILKLYIR